MKTARKIICVLAALAMVMATGVLLSGCGEEMTPEQKYDAAAKALKDAEDVSLKDGEISVDLDVSGQPFTIKMDVDAEYINNADDPLDTQMAMNMSANLFGQALDMHMYMKDKTMYMDSNGTKTKTPLDGESQKALKEYIEKSAGSEISIADYVTESAEEDGVITLKLDGKKMISDAMAKLGEEDVDEDQMKTIEEQIDKIGLKTITAKATIEDGNFKNLRYSTTLNLDPALLGTGSSDEPMKVKVKIKFDTIKTNTGLKIDFPDFSDYKEAAPAVTDTAE